MISNKCILIEFLICSCLSYESAVAVVWIVGLDLVVHVIRAVLVVDVVFFFFID